MRRVIIAGKEIEAIDSPTAKQSGVQSGRREFNKSDPTGRPLLAGDKVLVPTDTGLLTIATTGRDRRIAAL
jgi:hypothetical protein